MNHELIVVREQRMPSLLGLLLVVGFIVAFWKWFLLIVGIVSLLVLAYFFVQAIRKDAARQAALDAETLLRANRQLYGYMSGDPRATYGYDTEAPDGKESWR